MYYRLIAIALILIVTGIVSFNLRIEEDQTVETISVEVRGEVENEGVFELDYNSSFYDLLDNLELSDDANIDGFSFQEALFDGEIVTIPKSGENSQISINSATLEQLCLLPGIGEKTALKIIDYRNAVGYFSSLSELMNVKGIGQAKYEKLLAYICL